MDIIFKFLFEFINEYKFNTFIILFISCILNILKINILSYISANIIKSIEKNNINNIFKFYKYFIFISVIFIILFYIYKNYQNDYLCDLKGLMKFKMIKKLLIANNENYINKNYVKLNTSIIRVSSNCFYFFNEFITNIVPNLTLILIVSIYFLYNNLIFGLIYLISNLIILIYIYLNWNKLIESRNKYESNIIKDESLVSEILNNFEKIIYRGEIVNEIKEYNKSTQNVINMGKKFYKTVNYKSFIINILIFSSIFILIFYLIYIFINKKINSTIFITFLTILLLFRDIILFTSNNISNYVDFFSRTNIINFIFSEIDLKEIDKNDISYINNNLEFNTILFQNIYFKYKSHKNYILKNFCYKIECDNKIVGITGLSGIGKSTFAKLLIKLYKYDGNILIDNRNIKHLNTNYIRKNIVYINQDSKLFDNKIIDNIFYGCDNNKQGNVHLEEIMKFEKIKELFLNIDLNKKIVKSGENLSGGQKQVINIINGLVTPSKILILDEPTNALDISLKMEIINLILYFKKYKKCIIIISHDNDIYPYFDQQLSI